MCEESNSYRNKILRYMILWPWNHANGTITYPE